MSGIFHNFLSTQAGFIVRLQHMLGPPLTRKYHVYYTKFITNETQLYRATFLFSLITFFGKIRKEIFHSGGEIGVREFLSTGVNGGRLGFAIFSLLCVARLALHAIKLVLKIPRPFETFKDVLADKNKKGSYSFPSQSMMSISLIYGTIFRYWNLPYFLYVFLLSMIAISRIYRGLHYPYDIFASFLMGDLLQCYVLEWIVADNPMGHTLLFGFGAITCCFLVYYFFFSERNKKEKKKKKEK